MPTEGMDDLVRKLNERASRARDLTPAMKNIGEEIVTRTRAAFMAATSPAGDLWAPLAPSTLRQRAAKVPGAKKRGKGGGLTAGATKRRQAAVLSTKAIRPLVDTGHLAQKSGQYKAGPDSVDWSTLSYGLAHMAGSASKRPPKRNYAVYESTGTGQWKPIEPVLIFAAKAIANYIQTGSARVSTRARPTAGAR